MPNISLNIDYLKKEAPSAWADILLCYKKNVVHKDQASEIDFEDLSFILQIGLFKLYFEENGIDIDFNNLNFQDLHKEITNLIITHENVVKHYS